MILKRKSKSGKIYEYEYIVINISKRDFDKIPVYPGISNRKIVSVALSFCGKNKKEFENFVQNDKDML